MADVYERLHCDISLALSLGGVICMWDFNARTGAARDFVVNDDNCPGCALDMQPEAQRNNMDSKEDAHGKLLLQLCRTTGLLIANIRLKGDQLGVYTCFIPLPAAAQLTMCLRPRILCPTLPS